VLAVRAERGEYRDPARSRRADGDRWPAIAGRVRTDGLRRVRLGLLPPRVAYDRERAELGHPRLAGARRLIEAGAVRWLEEGHRGEVRSGDAVYRVELRSQPPHTCNCRWFAEHQGKRGTGKHVLATLMLARE